jgi:hypothetical protein
MDQNQRRYAAECIHDFSCLNLFARLHVIIYDFYRKVYKHPSKAGCSELAELVVKTARFPVKGVIKRAKNIFLKKSYLYPETTGFPVRLLMNEKPY